MRNYPTVIGFTGSGMGAGKSQAAMYACTYLNVVLNRSASIKKFAQPIYNATYAVCEALHIDFDKNRIRPLMQFIGNHMRAAYTPDFWVERWELDAKTELMFSKGTDPVIIADDIRFDNEAGKIKEMGGVIIKVEASPQHREKRVSIEAQSDVSENGINASYITATIWNQGSLQELELNVKYLMDTLYAKSKN